MYPKNAIVIAASALVIGCASVGSDFSMKDVDAFKPGITTLQEAETKLGKPMSTGYGPDGKISAMWTRSTGSVFGSSARSVLILFDKDGKMIRVVSRSEI
jgi:hypothetical protein